MTALATQPTFQMLAAIDADPSAALPAAREHDGYVHASWVRPHLPADITPCVIGAVIGALHRSGHLAPTTKPALPNGGGSGNASKLSRVSRLVRPIA